MRPPTKNYFKPSVSLVAFTATCFLYPPFALGQTRTLSNHAVFAKYPSIQDLLAEVETFKREHAHEFALALADFDLAVRSTRELVSPKIPGQPMPHEQKEWELYAISTRPNLEDGIINLQKLPGTEENIAFIRQHIDELTVDYTPALRIVALNVLLNGWNDWSNWRSDRLVEYRTRYPEIYEWDALMTLGFFVVQEGDKSLDGLLLRLLVDESLSLELRRQLKTFNFATNNDVEMLDFIVECYQNAEMPEMRDTCGAQMQRVSERVSRDQRRSFWPKFLDSPDKKLRWLAAVELSKSRLRESGTPLENHLDQEIVNRLQDVAANDPDESVRRMARSSVSMLLDDRPPGGLVTHENRELSPKEHQDFWVNLLTSDERPLRLLAAKGLGQYRQRPRGVPLSNHPEREIVKLLRRVAENDPDPEIREAAAKAAEIYTNDNSKTP